MNIIFIYALLDPRTGDIRYIGKTNNPHKRFIRHKNNREKRHCADWIASLVREELLPVMRILEALPDSTGNDAERGGFPKGNVKDGTSRTTRREATEFAGFRTRRRHGRK